MDTEKRELWDRLDNESERAHRAFQTFLSLPSDHRTIIEAYRVHVGNPEAVKPSDTWTRWSRDYAWSERAEAYDNRLASLRREAFERGIEEEAERQGALAERNRHRMNELMTLAYERALEWLENAQPSDLRAQDVLNIIRLHQDAVKAFEVDRQSEAEADWDEEALADLDEIVKEVDALADLERPDEGNEQGSEEETGEEDSESDGLDETG